MKKTNPVKEQLKKMSERLKQLRHEIADTQRKGNVASDLMSEQSFTKREFRHRHIAYGLLRGRTYEQIENKVKEGNEPNFQRVEDLKRKFQEELEEYYENVHSSS